MSPEVLAKPDAPSRAASGGWAATLGAALPRGNKAPELAMDGGLALQRAADKCLEELGACDAERLVRLREVKDFLPHLSSLLLCRDLS